MNFLTKDDLRKAVPVAFAEKPTRDVSKQYVFANTETVIDDLAKEGWLPREASQRSPRNGVETSFSPHMIRFANPDIVVKSGAVNDSFPEILVENRHDGLGAFKFSAGFFRLVCSNGLVIMTESFARVAIPHKGYTFDELREVVSKRVQSLPETIDIMNNMRGRMLTSEEQHALAMQAFLIRQGIDPATATSEQKPNKEIVIDMLTPVRSADKGKDLWTVFNVIQEKVIGGHFHTNTGRKARSITSFEKDMAINQKLFEAATPFIN